MATRTVHPKLLRNLPYFFRRLNSSTPPSQRPQPQLLLSSSSSSSTSPTPQGNFTGKPNPFAQQPINPEKPSSNLDDPKGPVNSTGKPDSLAQQSSHSEKSTINVDNSTKLVNSTGKDDLSAQQPCSPKTPSINLDDSKKLVNSKGKPDQLAQQPSNPKKLSINLDDSKKLGNSKEKPDSSAQQLNNPKKPSINLDNPKKPENSTGKPDPSTQPPRNPKQPAVDPDDSKKPVDQLTQQPSNPDEPSINLVDFKQLFSSVPTPKLIKSTATLHIASMDLTVDLGSRIMKSRLMKNPISRKMVFDSIKHTFYDHFCGGEDLGEADRTVKKLWNSGLKAMLDYGMEHAEDNVSCDRNLKEFIQTIESTKSPFASPISFVVVKITAICPPRLLERVSDLMRWEYKDKSLSLPWKLETFPIFSDSSPFYHTLERPKPLTPNEELDLDLAYQRLTKICLKSLEANVPLLIDAEDTLIQPAIDYLTYSAAIKHRTDDGPLIFNTIQAYLKDARERLVIAKKAADEMGVKIGFKLVRGAYMNSERALAASLGVESPVHDTIHDTHACYNDCTAFLLEEIARGSGSVVLATHNLESGKLAATKAVSLGIKKDNRNLHFAQLYGMAEALSFGLRNAGFEVSKYLPFGPVEQIMPYLMRRAEENRGLFSTSSLDKQLMRKELMRRLRP